MHHVPTGSLLFEQAERPNFAQFLLDGSIELLGVRDRVETLVELARPVDLIIPAAVVSGQPYLMRARVYDEAHLLMVPGAGLPRGRLVRSRAVPRCSGLPHVPIPPPGAHSQEPEAAIGRGARWGVISSHCCGSSDGEVTVRLPIEKHLIASQLGMTRETFSRALSGMARFGMNIHGEVVHAENAALARAHFPLDPLIDGPEPTHPA